MTAEVSEAIGWWSEFKTMGWLPWPGDIHAQPAFVYDALVICESEHLAIVKERSTNG